MILFLDVLTNAYHQQQLFDDKGGLKPPTMSKSTRDYPNSIRQIHSKCNVMGGGSYGITI